MYIAEVAPGKVRGRFVSINQLTIVIGILAAQITNLLIADKVEVNATDVEILSSWNGQFGWRWMFWAELVPAGLFLIFMWFVPESPRWLALKNKNKEKSISILKRIGGNEYALLEYENIAQTLKNVSKINLGDLFKPNVLKLLVIGIVIAVFQQWCGINVIFNYAEEVFSAAGYGVSDILFNIVLTGSVNLVFTLVAMAVVDKWGRKGLMLTGAGGLAGIYGAMGIMYYFQIQGWPLLVLVVLAISCYAMSLAPVTWVVLSEIFPNRIRGAAMSIATIALWSACFLLTYTFPLLNNMLKASGTFWLYGFICVLGFWFIYKKLPETKGKSLETIESEFAGQ
jgi:SP family sugar porter-like MFS transporter